MDILIALGIFVTVFGLLVYICMREDLKDPNFRRGLWNGQKDE